MLRYSGRLLVMFSSLCSRAKSARSAESAPLEGAQMPSPGSQPGKQDDDAVHELAQLTWEEVRDLDREHTSSCSGRRHRGPRAASAARDRCRDRHRDGACGRAANSRTGHVVLILPACLHRASFGSAFHGLVISAITVTALIVDVARKSV